MSQLFAMHDSSESEKKSKGCFPVDPELAQSLNSDGFGIFWTVNEFKPGTRKMETLVEATRFAVDIDEGSKEYQVELIKSAPLVPSLVIETKRGYQVYYNCVDLDPAYWNAINLDRLVPFFGADSNARDICRILRAPGFFHMKNPEEPFRCDIVYSGNHNYKLLTLARMFPDASEPAKDEYKKSIGEFKTGDIFDRIFHLDHEIVLDKLSGHELVRGESFTFQKNSNGTKQIFVDGKSTPTWIDLDGRIGSQSGGGPTGIQWIMWYGHSKRIAIEAMKELFPELKDKV